MAVTKHSCIQGDSYAYDYVSPSIPSFDGNWSGAWAIVDKLGAGRVTLASGILNASTDTTALEMRITPADTSPIAEGDYYLVVQVTNTTISFNKEIVQDPFKITSQGI